MNTDMIAPYLDNHYGPIHHPFVSDDFPHPIRDLPFDPIMNLLSFEPVLELPSFEPVPELPSLEHTPELFQNNSLVNSMHHNQTNDWCIVQ